MKGPLHVCWKKKQRDNSEMVHLSDRVESGSTDDELCQEIDQRFLDEKKIEVREVDTHLKVHRTAGTNNKTDNLKAKSKWWLPNANGSYIYGELQGIEVTYTGGWGSYWDFCFNSCLWEDTLWYQTCLATWQYGLCWACRSRVIY